MTTQPTAFNYFNYAQTFYLDPSLVKNSNEVGITRIDLFFRAKPPEKNNKSGILAPGVEVRIVPVKNGVPVIDAAGAVRPTEPTEHGAKFAFYSTGSVARKEWGEIQATPDASAATVFKFSQPFFVRTDNEYAILVKFDGNEDFVLWSSKKGDTLVGTQTISPGVSGPFIGNLFEFIGPLSMVQTAAAGVVANNAAVQSTAKNSPKDSSTSDKYLSANWKPITEVDLKFRVYIARYSVANNFFATNTNITTNPAISSSISVSPNTNVINVTSGGVVTLAAQVDNQEYILFDRRLSVTRDLKYGDAVYQVAPFWPGNRVVAGVLTPLTVSVTLNSDTVTANGNYILANGATFSASGGFNNLFTLPANEAEYIVVSSGNTVNIRRISSIVSSTVLKTEEPFDFSNGAAYFMRAPVGFIGGVSKAYIFGNDDDLLTLYNSNANSSVRFVNNTITEVNITTAGGGYSNTDYLVIGNNSGAYGARGFEYVPIEAEGGYSAFANIVTNASGNITAVYISNSGAGFVNTAWLTGSNIAINNSSNLPVPSATANSATFTFTSGATLKTEFTGGDSYFANTRVINIEAMRVKPEITVNNPLGTVFSIRHRTLFYANSSSNTFSGKAYYVANASQQSASDRAVKIFKSHTMGSINSAPVITSRSNEFIIRYANGAATNTDIIGKAGKSNNSIFLFDISSNSDYTAAFFDPDIVNSHYAKYVINNDYTDEHTNYGNAYAKHITTKVSFPRDRFAEDLLVYLTAYRPSGTDIKVYARLHNSNDPEPFDDKDWTLLEATDGNNIFSSRDNSADFIEITYNLTQYPNTASVLAGTVSVEQGNDQVTGSLTKFDTDLAADDLIKIYPPLFPNNYVVCVVNNVISNTSLKIKRAFGDLSANLQGSVSANTTSPNVEGTSTTFLNYFSNGDFIAIWDSTTVYEVRKINVVTNNTFMNLTSTITFTNTAAEYAKLEANTFTNASISGTGLKIDKLAFKNQAFNNQINENVARYYNTSMVEFDGFDSFQLKLVMLSNNEFVVPKIDDVRAIGVSS